MLIHLINSINFAPSVFAHEAYVLPSSEFQKGLQTFSPNPLAPLFSPAYLFPCSIITLVLVLVYLVNFFWASTSLASKGDKMIKRLSDWGLLAVRLALAGSFLYGAFGGSFFGPEISVNAIVGGQIIIIIKIIVGILLALGLFTRLAALVGLLIYLYIFSQIGTYLLTYLNYFGELLVLFLFGSQFLSLDSLIFKRKGNFEKWREWEVPVVRVFFGLALIYTAISIKFLHQGIPVEVINQYHLQRYFAGSAEFIAAGAGVSELAIGLFILLGFGQRLTVIILFTFLTLSLLFFKEAVWPHLMLYGIGIMIFINSGDKFTVDHNLVELIKRKLKIRGV